MNSNLMKITNEEQVLDTPGVDNAIINKKMILALYTHQGEAKIQDHDVLSIPWPDSGS
jgi:hypothetical protein